MRALLLLVAVAGCYREATPASAPPPANKQQPLVAPRDVDDELSFLPKESELVFGFDMTTLRTSAAWREQIEPALAASSALEKTRKLCGFDPLASITHLSIGARKADAGNELVFTLAGGDAQQQIGCLTKQLDGDYAAQPAGDVTLITKKQDTFALALAPVGRQHILGVSAPGVDAKRVRAQAAIGSPLRASPAFMNLYDKLERGASVWFVLNGASPMFQSFSLGVRPRYIDGTIVITDRYVWTTRITMETPADASQLATMFRGAANQVKQMVETLEIREDGEVLHVDVVLTQPQVQTILALLGTMI
ncbi:MAG TPA: hypothetical protein VMZ53_18225 [Kofleriaceae bacterium]|nr:hypothetical protein [Kofleriaceae bacterium]